VCTFGGEIPRVPGAAIKNTCLTVYIVLLGFSYRIFESIYTLVKVITRGKTLLYIKQTVNQLCQGSYAQPNGSDIVLKLVEQGALY